MLMDFDDSIQFFIKYVVSQKRSLCRTN